MWEVRACSPFFRLFDPEILGFTLLVAFSLSFLADPPLLYVMVSGGLGVEAEKGAINFDVQNYANDIVAAMVDVCTMKNIDPPILVKSWNSTLFYTLKELRHWRVFLNPFWCVCNLSALPTDIREWSISGFPSCRSDLGGHLQRHT